MSRALIARLLAVGTAVAVPFVGATAANAAPGTFPITLDSVSCRNGSDVVITIGYSGVTKGDTVELNSYYGDFQPSPTTFPADAGQLTFTATNIPVGTPQHLGVDLIDHTTGAESNAFDFADPCTGSATPAPDYKASAHSVYLRFAHTDIVIVTGSGFSSRQRLAVAAVTSTEQVGSTYTTANSAGRFLAVVVIRGAASRHGTVVVTGSQGGKGLVTAAF